MHADKHGKHEECRLKGQVLVEDIVDSDIFLQHFENLGSELHEVSYTDYSMISSE